MKIYVNPVTALMSDALTMGYLRPALRLKNHPKAESLVVWYDTSDLVLRPDRSKEAIELHDRGLVGDETARRENGFSEDDAPTQDEMNRWILLQLAKDFPQLAAGVVPKLTEGIGTVQIALPAGTSAGTSASKGTGGTPGVEAPAGPSAPLPPTQGTPPPAAGGKPAGITSSSTVLLVEHEPQPCQVLPITVQSGHEATVATAEAGVLRALEMAGKRMLPTHERGRLAHVEAWDLHTHLLPGDPDRLLTGAFDLLDKLIERPCVRQACHTYVRTLLETRSPHRRDVLERILSACTGGPDA